MTTQSAAKRSKARSWIKELAIIVVGALVLSFLLKTFLIQSFYIPSGSMEQTLELNDRVVVSRLAPGPLDVHRGDIVVFKDDQGWLPESTTPEQTGVSGAIDKALTFVGLKPEASDEYLIKRVIGVGGDHVACCDAQGRITVNGQGIDETYIYPGDPPSQMEFNITVPQNGLWVMGDHRSNSEDSRYHQDQAMGGSIAVSSVVGVAFMRTWPLDRFALLRNPGSVFADVPDP